MVATIAAGTTAGYYTKQAEYYLGGREPAGRWISRTGNFGVMNGAEIDRAQFERLHAGLDEDGKQLLSNSGDVKQRVAGYDLTLSAPKSVSILYALADPQLRTRIEAAQQRAVEATIKVLDDHAAFGRRGENGLQFERVSLSVASFQHGEARPVDHEDGKTFTDPNLHTHCVILNTAVRADGTVGALDGRFLFQWKMAAGAAYHAALSAELQADSGFSIGEIGKNGIFEVVGVPREIRAYFSARRREIEDSIAKEGVATTAAAPALAAAIALSSRSSKAAEPSIDRFEMWRNEAAQFGIEPERFVSNLQHEGSELNAADRDRIIAERMGALPRQLTENESVFEKRQLYAAVASGLVGTGAGAERIEAEVATLVANQGIVELGQDDLNQPIYSTPEMVRIEREFVSLTQRLVARNHSAPDPRLVAALCKNCSLNAEQTAAALAATDRRSIAICEGSPGSGKTTMLRPIVNAFAGMRVIGTATAWRIANQLRDDLGIESKATDSWIASARAGGRFLDRNSVLVVDESGLLSSRQMHAVLSEVAKAGAKVILVGDRQQLQAIGAGPGLQIVASVVAASRVDTIVRQRQAWARAAVVDIAKGRVAEALGAFAERGLVTACDGNRAAVRALVDAWQRAQTETPDASTLLIAKSNAQVRAINEEVRTRLQRQGQIRGPEIEISAVTASGHTQPLRLAAGDSIRFLARQDNIGVINGTVGTVDKIQGIKGTNPRITARVGDQNVSFRISDIADEAGRARLTHAYGSTIYGAQGLTVDQAFVLIGPAMNRHDLVVASSRGRDRTEHFLDNREVDAQIRAGLPLSDRRSAQIEAEARLSWLADRLSRVQVKTCTLDPTLVLAEQSRALARERSRGLDLE